MAHPPYASAADSPGPVPPSPVARRLRRNIGPWALLVALVALVILVLIPAPYVIQKPGPVYDTLASITTADGEEVPLISVEGAESYPASGNLWLTTVQVQGNREQSPGWAQLALAWFDPSRAVLPVDAVFPAGVTAEQRTERNATLMVNSQTEATAAALGALGYDLNAEVEVAQVVEGSPAEGVLEPGDRLISANGRSLPAATSLREIVQEGAGDAVEILLVRDGAERTVQVTPEAQRDEQGEVWLLGITLTTAYDFPIDVTIQLDNVGGPSAGLMFALGIVDMLTPGDLTGGADVAGTGTISADGTVGMIGGVRQKIFGARDVGAAYFLVPPGTCGELAGHVPDGIRPVPTATLDEARDALAAIAADDLDALPRCPAV